MKFLPLLLFTALSVSAQEKPTPGEIAFFAHYPARHVPLPRTKPKAMIHKGDETFRTRLRRIVEGQPNFADHMRLEVWGCGTGCVIVGIADLTNGSTYLFPESLSAETGRRLIANSTSRAIHMVGLFNEEEAADRWYVWNGTGLKLVEDVPLPHGCFSGEDPRSLPTARCNFQPPESD